MNGFYKVVIFSTVGCMIHDIYSLAYISGKPDLFSLRATPNARAERSNAGAGGGGPTALLQPQMKTF